MNKTTRLLAILALALVAMAVPRPVGAQGACSIFRSWTTGNSLTAPDLTTSFTQVGVTNMIPACMQSVGTTTATHQATTDPWSGQTAALPGTIGDEIKQLRFVIQQNFGTTFWYTHTDARTIGPTAPSNTPTDQAGKALTLHSGSGTGTGVGGAVNLQLSYPGVTGTAINALSTVLAFSGTNNQAAGTVAMLTHTPTINQSGTAGYTALKVNVTETATGSGTKLLADLQTGAVSKFQVDRTGNILFAAGSAGGATIGTLTSSPITTARTWTLPDITGIVALTNGGQTFTSATWNGSIVGTLFGGTGINTSATAAGSILHTSGVGTWTTVAATATGTVLRMGGSNTPAWDHTGPLMSQVFN